MPKAPPGNSIISLSMTSAQALDLGHAVTCFADDADVRLGNRSLKTADFRFQFLKNVTHFRLCSVVLTKV